MSQNLSFLVVIGTRPEAIKMAPVIYELAGRKEIEARTLITGQHQELVEQALQLFDIQADYDIRIMKANQTPTDVLAAVLQGLQPILRDYQPDWVLVQGDTTTVLAAALASAYAGCRVAHVEAGLRTYDRANPFPEELNRVLTDHASDLHFAPTLPAKTALLKEGISEAKIHVTGNTVIDALRYMAAKPAPESVQLPEGKRLLLVTAHRRENHGQPLQNILQAIKQLAERPDLFIVYPVHPNPNVFESAHATLAGIPNVKLSPPLGYLEFVHWLKQASLILTDSGGIQEEAPTFGVPVLILRETTERPEAIDAGTAKLVGTDTNKIVAEATELLDNPVAYEVMSKAVNPFGDGTAATQIIQILVEQ